MLPNVPLGVREDTVITCEAFGTGNGRSSRPSARLKIVALAPMPNAIETMAVKAKPGFCRSVRRAYRKSFHIVHLPVHLGSQRVRSVTPTTRVAPNRARMSDSGTLRPALELHSSKIRGRDVTCTARPLSQTSATFTILH